MTGTWWPLAALLPLISVTIFPAYCQHTADYKLTFILAIKNNDSGLEVYTVFPENRGSQIDDSGASQWHEHELDPQMHFFFPDRNLSSWCGDQYFRCQELLVEDAGGRFTVVFVPLENGILLLSYWYDLNTTTIEWSSCIVDIYSFNCSPIVFYKISSKFYVVCISSYEYFAVYEVRLNLSGSVIEDATLLGPLTEKCISNSPPSSHISNFALVEHMVYFAIDNTIIVMDIFDLRQTCQYSNNSDCGEIHKLVPTIGDGNQPILVAYCTDRYIYFDPIYGDWTDIQLFSIHGVPYLCPDKEYSVTLFNNSVGEDILQFSVRGSVPNMIRNVNISSGICFKSQNRTYFAYSDQQNNSVFVYDFIPRNHYPVSPYDCSHLDCPQLLLLGDQYLVVRGADYDLVLDTKTNFSLITNISSDVPDILVVLHSNIITPSPPIIHSTTTVKVPPVTASSTLLPTSVPLFHAVLSTFTDNAVTVTPTAVPTHVSLPQSNLLGTILAVVIGLFVIIAILVTVVVGLSIQHRRNKWCNKIYRIPRLRFITNQRSPVPLLAADSDQEEDSESYEMESMSHFGKGWRWTTTL